MAQLKNTNINGDLTVKGVISLVDENGNQTIVNGGGSGSADTSELEKLLEKKPGLIVQDEEGNTLGEIFNTYDGEYKNQALGPASSAFGYGTIAGCKGYYIKSIDLENKKIYLTETQVLPVISTDDNTDVSFETPAYESGDLFTISNQLLWVNCSAIDSIVNNVITYTTDLPFTTIENSDYADGTPYDTEEYSLLVLTKPTVGLNIVQIAGFAYGLQSISVGTGALAAGYNSIAFKYGDATGYQAIAGYAAHAEGKLTEAHRYGHAEGYGTKALSHAAHAEGRETTASGIQSHAEGRYSIASNNQTHAEGNSTEATGAYSHAEGYLTDATKTASHAEGRETTASGNFAHAEGRETIASGSASHAEGYLTQAHSTGAHAEGSNTIANTSSSHAEGYNTIASSNYQHVQGKYNIEDSANKYAHIVGGGNATTRKNIHTLDWNGNAYFAGEVDAKTVSGENLNISKPFKCQGILIGSWDSGGNDTFEEMHQNGISIGEENSPGDYSMAIGQFNLVTNSYSMAVGYNNKVSGEHSIAIGDNNQIGGKNGLVVGEGLKNNYYWGIVNGYYNNTNIQTPADESDFLHVVGNGWDNESRNNCYSLDAYGNIWAEGSIQSTGSDYAEYFEWVDGNLNNEDRIGSLVTLDGDKIRLANAGDEILGIISGTVAILGDSYEWQWQGKYLTDEWGRIQYQNVEKFKEIENKETGEIELVSVGIFKRPILNPNYDPNQEYINRANRPEWDAVGMLGKLYVRDDGTCIPNYYATVGENGIATSSLGKTNMRVLSRVNENIVRVLLK